MTGAAIIRPWPAATESAAERVELGYRPALDPRYRTGFDSSAAEDRLEAGQEAVPQPQEDPLEDRPLP